MKTRVIIPLALLFFAGHSKSFSQTVAAGSFHSMALCTSDNMVRSWGGNTNGQLGFDDTVQQPTLGVVHGPGNIGALKNVKAIIVRENFSVVLKNDSTVWAWGFNGDGELGDNTKVDKWIPVQVHGPNNVGYLTGIVSIAAGYQHVLALRKDGTVWAWGDNVNGELGDNTLVYDSTPVQVHGPGNAGFLTGVTYIAAGQQFSMALGSGGSVWAWGLNAAGELGDFTSMERHTPIQVHGPGNVGFLVNITALACGGGHTLALKNDSTIYSWGFNINGELGDNTTNYDSIPKQVHGPANVGNLSGVISIATGDYFSTAIAKDSTVWAWGYNYFGQLGINDTTDSHTPVHVHGPGNVGFLSEITSISLGDEHALATKKDGTVWAWGWNGNGQLGDGTYMDKWTPIQVASPCSINLGLANITDKNVNVKLYPNPNNGQFNLLTESNTSRLQLSVYNMLGEDVYNAKLNPSNNEIDLSSIANGIYLYRVISEDGSSMGEGKFIKQ